MAAKKKLRRRVQREVEPPILTPASIAHRICAVFERDLYAESSAPRFSSKGELIWEAPSDWGDLGELWELRKFFVDTFEARALEKAVAKRLKEMGVTPPAKPASAARKAGRQ